MVSGVYGLEQIKWYTFVVGACGIGNKGDLQRAELCP